MPYTPSEACQVTLASPLHLFGLAPNFVLQFSLLDLSMKNNRLGSRIWVVILCLNILLHPCCPQAANAAGSTHTADSKESADSTTGTMDEANVTTIYGATGAFPSLLYRHAITAYHFVRPEVEFVYSPMTSHRSTCRLMDHATVCHHPDELEPKIVDFAGTDAVLEDSQYEAYPDLQLFPTVAGGVVPIYNLGFSVELVLTPYMLSQMFCGFITMWDAPEILAHNPQLAGRAELKGRAIEIVVHKDQSGVTEIFKNALSSFDPAFVDQMGSSNLQKWTNVTVTEVWESRVPSYVLVNNYTIGYTALSGAREAGQSVAKIKKNGFIVEANSASVEYALMELGLSFGNNGEDPMRLTAGIHNALGQKAWPIAGYSYLAMRKNGRPGASCDSVLKTMEFWHWFWHSNSVRELAIQDDFAILPSVVRDVVVKRFISDIRCNGELVWKSGNRIQVTGVGTQVVSSLFMQLNQVYQTVDEFIAIDYDVDDTPASPQDFMFVASPKHSISNAKDEISLMLAGFALVMVGTIELLLDVETIARIFEGEITGFTDSRIRSLNRELVVDHNARIQLVRGPMVTTEVFTALMTRHLPYYTGAAIMAAPVYQTEGALRDAVLATPYAVAVTNNAGSFHPDLYISPLQRPVLVGVGPIVRPTIQAIQACASTDVYDEATNSYRMHESQDEQCYPMSYALYITMWAPLCQPTDPRTKAAEYVEWLFRNDLAGVISSQNLAPMNQLPNEILKKQEQSLQLLSCIPKYDSSWMLPMILGFSGALVLVIGAGGWIAWRATTNMRQMAAQQSNSNVAQECASAIARLDLEAVEWLNKIEKPNKIQSSFIQIVVILRHLKQYVPDQALNLYCAEDCNNESHNHTPRGADGKAFYHVRNSVSPLSSARSSNSKTTATTGSRNALSPKSQKSFQGAEPDVFTSKRCTHMYVHFGYQAFTQDLKACDKLASIAGQLIKVAKKHNATICNVDLNSMLFCWGLTGSRPAMGSVQATQTAMELAAWWPENDHGPFGDVKLQIGIGVGSTALGEFIGNEQRFFVMTAAERRTATKVATRGLPENFMSMILISANVYHEVQYHFDCYPRMYFDGVLMWEPVKEIKLREGGSFNEWMYELADEGTQERKKPSAQKMHQVFEMVGGSPNGMMKDAVNALIDEAGSDICPKNRAALQWLIKPCGGIHSLLERVRNALESESLH